MQELSAFAEPLLRIGLQIMPTGRCVEFNGLARNNFLTVPSGKGVDRPVPRIVETETPMLALHEKRVKN